MANEASQVQSQDAAQGERRTTTPTPDDVKRFQANIRSEQEGATLYLMLADRKSVV